MADTAKIIIGILATLLVLSTGVQYVLNETGSNKACSSGWVFQETGDHEGTYACQTSTSVRYEYCSRVWDTATGKKNYWCAQAVPVFVEPEPVKDEVKIVPSSIHNAPQYKCDPSGCVLIAG